LAVGVELGGLGRVPGQLLANSQAIIPGLQTPLPAEGEVRRLPYGSPFHPRALPPLSVEAEEWGRGLKDPKVLFPCSPHLGLSTNIPHGNVRACFAFDFGCREGNVWAQSGSSCMVVVSQEESPSYQDLPGQGGEKLSLKA
jgi:hypothetical protein